MQARIAGSQGVAGLCTPHIFLKRHLEQPQIDLRVILL